MTETAPETFTGTAYCTHCRTPLARARGVFAHEKEWHRRMAVWNVRPECEHVKSFPFMDCEVEWTPETAA